MSLERRLGWYFSRTLFVVHCPIVRTLCSRLSTHEPRKAIGFLWVFLRLLSFFGGLCMLRSLAYVYLTPFCLVRRLHSFMSLHIRLSVRSLIWSIHRVHLVMRLFEPLIIFRIQNITARSSTLSARALPPMSLERRLDSMALFVLALASFVHFYAVFDSIFMVDTFLATISVLTSDSAFTPTWAYEVWSAVFTASTC